MKNEMDHKKVIIGISVGIVIGILLASLAFYFIRVCKMRSSSLQTSERNTSSLPIRMNGVGASIASSAPVADSEALPNVSHAVRRASYWTRQNHHPNDLSSSISGIQRYPHKDILKATDNFTTILGRGSFGPVYKATMSTGEVVAIKVLASDSKQGKREFQTEILLLSRLHHRNLVNLVGYCVDKGSTMLLYEFMSNGSLESYLHNEGSRTLSWEQRLQIALDVSHGIEYLHEGANPPVIHRDLKSANILLDRSMTAKVADFGFSKEDVYDGRKSTLKGTYGYMDPNYMSTNRFTKSSDVYSFGIILFELITAIDPQQGLMDYIDLALIGEEGDANWVEIIDKKLLGGGKCSSNLEEIEFLADIAYRCLHKNPRKRPPIEEVTLAVSRIRHRHLTSKDSRIFPGKETVQVLERIEIQQLELDSLA